MLSLPRLSAEPSPRYKYLVIALTTVSSPPLLAIHDLKWLGWILLLAAAIGAAFKATSRYGQHMLLLIGMLIFLGLVPINTDISYDHMLIMGSVLIATVALPYMATRYYLKDSVITFPFRMGRHWNRQEIGYIVFAGFAAYLILPFYLANTGSYLNWEAVLEPSHIIRLFIGTNALGIWDELFFVGVCLALLRQHIPFLWANVVQAILWTAFLYELGFQGWGPPLILLFALSQGYIFRKSKSLLYVIAVHLTIDFILFLTLIHLHHPHLLRIFITSPF